MGHSPVVFPPSYKPGPPFDPSYINFTISTRESPQPKLLDPSNLKDVKNKKTIIIIGGWEYAFPKHVSYFGNMTRAYLNKGDYNVIGVRDLELMNVSLNESLTYTEPIGKSLVFSSLPVSYSDIFFSTVCG